MRHRTGQFYGHYATDALCCETAKSYLRVEPQYLDPKRFQSRLRLTTNLQAFDGVCATVYRSHTSEDVIHILHGPSKIGQCPQRRLHATCFHCGLFFGHLVHEPTSPTHAITWAAGAWSDSPPRPRAMPVAPDRVKPVPVAVSLSTVGPMLDVEDDPRGRRELRVP